MTRQVALLGMAVAGLVLAGPGGTARAADMKIGSINMAKVFDGYEKTRRADAALEQKGKQKSEEFEGRLKELQTMRQNLELLNDSARDAKVREIEEKSDSLKRFRDNAARDLQRERSQIAQNLLREIRQTVEEYGKANGFTIILNEQSAVLYMDGAHDVTGEILALLNNRVKR